MSQLRLLSDFFLWLKKIADVNPTDLDPKTRSVNDVFWRQILNILSLLFLELARVG
jgi:hypothetical protein